MKMIRIPTISIFALLFLSVTVLSSCDDDPVMSGTMLEEDLVGTAWKLYSVEAISDTILPFDENGIWLVPENNQYLLEFNSDSTIYAFLNCEECIDSEESRFELNSDNSVSINLDCSKYAAFIPGAICQENQNLKYFIEAAETVKIDEGFLKLVYNFEHYYSDGISRGVMLFLPVDHAKPEEIEITELRGANVFDCALKEDNIELSDEIVNLLDEDRVDDVTFTITTQEEFDTYLSCSDEIDFDVESEIILAGASKRNNSCISVYGQRAYFLNNVLYNSTSISIDSCDAIQRVSYIIKMPREHLNDNIEFKTYVIGGLR